MDLCRYSSCLFSPGQAHIFSVIRRVMEVRLETPEEAWSGHSGRPYTGDGYPPTFNEGPDIREQEGDGNWVSTSNCWVHMRFV